MRLPGCPFGSAWCLVCARFAGWADWVHCRCFLSFVFLGDARRLDLSPCNTMLKSCTLHKDVLLRTSLSVDPCRPVCMLFLQVPDTYNSVTCCEITCLWAAQVLFKDLPVAVAAVDCNGTEDSITECQSNDRRVSACTNFTSSTVLACANSGEGEGECTASHAC